MHWSIITGAGATAVFGLAACGSSNSTTQPLDGSAGSDGTSDAIASEVGGNADSSPGETGGETSVPEGGADAAPDSTPCTQGLDPSFGSQGIAQYAVPPNPNPATAGSTVLQPDGKIVVVGSLPSDPRALVARYKPDGTPDTTFGTGGIATLKPAAGQSYSAIALALQPDGGILVGGSGGAAGAGAALLLRLDALGGLDTGFGSSGYASAPAPNTSISQVLVRPNGAILAVGPVGTTQHQFFVAQYTSAGVLDTNFGTGGYVTTAFSGDARPFAALLEPDGTLVVGGENIVPTDAGGYTYPVPIVRYTTNGGLDTTFGSSGVVTPYVLPNTTLGVGAFVRQSTGAIVAAVQSFGNGDSYWNVDLLRYTTGGQLDTTFGTSGVAQVHVEKTSVAQAMSLLPGDGLLVSAYAREQPDAGGLEVPVLLRFTSGGMLDPTFANGGVAAISIAGLQAYVQSQALQPDQKVVFSTSSLTRIDGGNVFYLDLVRYCL